MRKETPTYVQTRTIHLFGKSTPFRMDCGRSLGDVTVAYETYGTLNAAGDNAILVCHALTGNAHAGGFSSPDPRSAGWWEPLIGPGRGLDTERSFVVASNILGSCYGTTGPPSVDPDSGKPYAMDFPQMTVRDMVRLQKSLLDTLGVRSLRTVIGGSLGGMQALEWACLYPEFARSVVPIGTASRHSPWCIGLNEIGRQAIMNDPAWQNGEYYATGQPERGLSLARQVAMISYRSDQSFLRRFNRDRRKGDGAAARYSSDNIFEVESYLHYQGEKLVQRFDANSYLYITRAMDLHDIGYERGSVKDVLGSLRMPALCIGISSDVLYPVHEQRELASQIPRATYREIQSEDGHDAFLIEHGQMAGFLQEFFREHGLT
jgi:homoserine O-acetyltransferase/O-succinyltransferase